MERLDASGRRRQGSLDLANVSPLRLSIRSAVFLGVAVVATSGAMAAQHSTTGTDTAGFEDFLPAPLDRDWTRSTPRTTRAREEVFGGGVVTRAEYLRGEERCVITITGESQMLQGMAMTFSNPAVANMEGAQNRRIGDQRIIVKDSGEMQAFANNFLAQYTGNCSEASKIAYIQATDFDGLRRFLGTADSDAAAASSAPQQGLAWERTFGGEKSDWAYAMTGTRDGGLATGGRTESKGAGQEDLWVVRIDAQGNRVWDRTFGGAATDRGRAIRELRDGGFAVAGATESKGAGEFDAWVLRLNKEGTLLWDRRFGGAGTDWASGVVETRDGGLAVAAYTQPNEQVPFTAWIIKLDADGNSLWERRFGGEQTDWATAIAETRDGRLVVSGYTESRGAGNADLWVLLLEPDGELVWQRTFGGPERDYASTVYVTRDNAIVLAGMTESAGAGGVDIRLIRLNVSGEVTWDRTYGGARDDWIRGLVETADGTLATAGYTTSSGAGLYDVWVLELSPDGELLGERTYGGRKNEWARAIVALPNGDLATAGDTWSKGAGKSDVWVLRISADSLAATD
jgi:hypothetical protein